MANFLKILPSKKQMKLLSRSRKGFLSMSLIELRDFLKDIELIAKDLRSSKSVREVVLLTDLIVEKILNDSISKILGLDSFKKSNVDIKILKKLTFEEKLEIVKVMRKTYKKSPKHFSYKGIQIDGQLRDYLFKEHKGLFDEIIRVEEEYKKEKGIPVSVYINPYQIPDIHGVRAYIEEDKFNMLEKMDSNILTKMKMVRDARNIVAHRIDYEKQVAEILGVSLEGDLLENAKAKCGLIVKELGLKVIKTRKPSC